MPIEVVLLKDKPIKYSSCPKCKMSPFEPFLRGQVQRRKRSWIFQRKRPYCAIICSSCKEVVGWEYNGEKPKLNLKELDDLYGPEKYL